MKKTSIIGIIVISLLFLAGCVQQQYPATGPKVEVSEKIPASEETGTQQEAQPENDTEINPITNESYHDIKEKRGYKTNITDFNELLKRASSIESYKYNITDTGISDNEYRFFVKGRFVKMMLPEAMQHKTGEIYDEVLMDRVTKTAFSHCGRYSCPKPNLDKEIEKVDYEEYYMNDPMEYLYKAIANPQYLKEEMIGEQYTKVFKTTFEGRPAKIWLQEYYGFPLRIEVTQPDGTKRKITFEDMMVDATTRGEIELPFNFTVKGEGNQSWYFWEHYLGEWPKEGQQITLPGQEGEPALGI
jgi:hypothetical protein